MMPAVPIAVAVGFGFDRLVGEPPARLHPVAWFGTAMQWVERHLYRDGRVVGVAHVAVGVGSATFAGRLLTRLCGPTVACGLASWIAIAGRMLEREARSVGDALDCGDVDEARVRVARLVGRSTAGLDAVGVGRAAVETVAENCVDAVVGSMCWAVIGGAPAVLAHRAVNTMDAMVGHRDARYQNYGWAGAKLDDAANWVPARLTVLAVMIAAPGRSADVWRTVRRDASAHPSPNGGVVEAAFAAALGIRLGGANTYGDQVEHRGDLGDGRDAGAHDVARATRLALRVQVIVLTLTVATGVAGRRAIGGADR